MMMIRRARTSTSRRRREQQQRQPERPAARTTRMRSSSLSSYVRVVVVVVLAIIACVVAACADAATSRRHHDAAFAFGSRRRGSISTRTTTTIQERRRSNLNTKKNKQISQHIDLVVPTTTRTAGSTRGGSPRRRSELYAVVDPISATATAAATASAASSSLLVKLLFASPAVGAVGVLAFIILVHELGHYLAARALYKMKVEEFSIGVGPKLFGFKAFNGDEFNLRALPLGGYVRFPENYNATLVRELERKAFEIADQFDQSQNKSLMDKVLNVITFGAVDDQRRKAEKKRRIEAYEENQRLPWWKKIDGQQQQQLTEDDLLLDPDDVDIEYYDDPNLLQNRPWYQRAVVLSGGVFFNLLLSFLIYFGQITFGPGLPSPVFDSGALVTSTPQPDAAAAGLLKKGDVVLSVDGKPITLSSASSSISAGDAQKGIGEFISKIRSTNEGEVLHLTVLHPGDRTPVEITVKPRRTATEASSSPSSSAASTSNNGPATIGVLLSPNYVKSKMLKSDSVFEGAGMAAEYVSRVTADTAKGLLSAFGDLARGKGVSNQVSGPIGLIETGTEVVRTQDWTTVLIFAAAISINLGVVNALPLPALDGGQLLFVLSEAITGRKVDQRLQEGITGAALFFLLLLSVGAAFNDIEALFH